jgi:division protein CdvB (Snf7/Vps24/ESCRT-III family)
MCYGIFPVPPTSSLFTRWSEDYNKKRHNDNTENVTPSESANRLLDAVKSTDPLKPGLEATKHRLGVHILKMENRLNDLKQKDRHIFREVAEALENHDTRQATSLSNELSQVRKITKIINSTRMSTEQVELRLETMTELGDVMFTLSPVTSAVKKLKVGLSLIMPGADQALAEISSTLGEVLSETTRPASGITEGMSYYSDNSGEIMKIIEEASAIAEVNTAKKIPDLSSATSDNTKRYSSTNDR